jgi:hypothetical protein
MATTMKYFSEHQPPPPTIVEALIRAGISAQTVAAMEGWKAREVLDLLRADHVVSTFVVGESDSTIRGTI